MARMLDRYSAEIVPFMMERFGYKNKLAVPRLQKIVLNMGIGKATENKNLVEAAAKDLMIIAGQKAMICKARKSIAGFKLREGLDIGAKVTLRGKRMWEFLDRLIAIALPRIKDFRGVPRKSFDKAGNYSLGVSEQTVFPEINIDQVQFVQGMDITLVIDNSTPEASEAMLEKLGMPFKR